MRDDIQGATNPPNSGVVEFAMPQTQDERNHQSRIRSLIISAALGALSLTGAILVGVRFDIVNGGGIAEVFGCIALNILSAASFADAYRRFEQIRNRRIPTPPQLAAAQNQLAIELPRPLDAEAQMVNGELLDPSSGILDQLLVDAERRIRNTDIMAINNHGAIKYLIESDFGPYNIRACGLIEKLPTPVDAVSVAAMCDHFCGGVGTSLTARVLDSMPGQARDLYNKERTIFKEEILISYPSPTEGKIEDLRTSHAIFSNAVTFYIKHGQTVLSNADADERAALRVIDAIPDQEKVRLESAINRHLLRVYEAGVTEGKQDMQLAVLYCHKFLKSRTTNVIGATEGVAIDIVPPPIQNPTATLPLAPGQINAIGAPEGVAIDIVPPIATADEALAPPPIQNPTPHPQTISTTAPTPLALGQAPGSRSNT